MDKARYYAENFDGLLIIHPDCSWPDNPHYKENMRKLVGNFAELGKPVFLIDDFPVRDAEIQEILSVAHNVPNAEKMGFMRLHSGAYDLQEQKAVDFIAGKIGKPHEEIRLAFGGRNPDGCVYSYGTNYCGRFESPYRGRKEPPVERPIGFGQVLREIV
jgi:hypothetical protein